MNNVVIIYVILTLVFIVVFSVVGSILHNKVELMSKEYIQYKKASDNNINKLDTHKKAVLTAAIYSYLSK